MARVRRILEKEAKAQLEALAALEHEQAAAE